MPITLLIADDQEVVRCGLKSMFEKSEFRVIAEASDGDAAFKLAKKHRPNLVILDVRMPVSDGLKCLQRLRHTFPEIPVVMFSSYDNPTYVARSVALGAVGFILKSAGRDEILKSIRAAAGGESIWTKEELRRVTGSLMVPQPVSDTDTQLTKREGDVLKQIALGLSNKEIAQALGISYETVKEHVQHVLQKLGVSDRTQAAVWAVRKGLL